MRKKTTRYDATFNCMMNGWSTTTYLACWHDECHTPIEIYVVTPPTGESSVTLHFTNAAAIFYDNVMGLFKRSWYCNGRIMFSQHPFQNSGLSRRKLGFKILFICDWDEIGPDS